MRFFVWRNVDKRFTGEIRSARSKRNKMLSGFTNFCVIPSIYGSFFHAIAAFKASNFSWKHDTKCADASPWDNHQVVAAFINFQTLLCFLKYIYIAALILEYFMSFHNARMVSSVFSIWKSLWVLQTACIKVVAHAIYTYQFFSFKCSLFCGKIKSCCDCYFP